MPPEVDTILDRLRGKYPEAIFETRRTMGDSFVPALEFLMNNEFIESFSMETITVFNRLIHPEVRVELTESLFDNLVSIIENQKR